MNPELQQQLADLLSSLKDGTVWIGSQIPPLVQEKILFGRVWETLIFYIFVMFVFVGVYVVRRLQRSMEETGDDRVPPIIILSVVTFAVGISALLQLQVVLQVWLAPRLYIIA